MANRLNEQQLDRSSTHTRYGLVSAELIRLQRGLYVLADRFRQAPPHPFALAQAIVGIRVIRNRKEAVRVSEPQVPQSRSPAVWSLYRHSNSSKPDRTADHAAR
jgi:hypothetical protein